jgi:hypothetical protein
LIVSHRLMPLVTDASGKTAYTYTHPLFRAPYPIIGDGG